ncbi:sulfite exporter TauE/SafE family protein [Cuniculiplasma sp. SKW3]|uniref:sulfite exporter TauE/SafE family protein n=1 Tax=unclassified Cuniculiplasma TaxID=2619706 RepID=UPI003FD41A0E
MTSTLFIGIYILIGIMTGILTGITGSSGVVIVVPALSFLGHTFQQAVGTSLLVDVITTVSVTYAYFARKNVRIALGLSLGAGAIIGAQLGALIALSLPEVPLEVAFAIFTLFMAFRAFRSRKKHIKSQVQGDEVKRGRIWYIAAGSLSILVGIVTGTMGASGGIMFIAVMMLIFRGMEVKTMVGTATLAMFLSAGSGASAYLLSGTVDIEAALIIGIFGLISGYFFGKKANDLKPATIYLFLGSLFVLVAISEFFRAFY